MEPAFLNKGKAHIQKICGKTKEWMERVINAPGTS
jgi:hypothetical protein